LITAGQSDSDILYLIKGRALIRDDAQNDQTVEAGSRRARYPLSGKMPHKINVFTQGASTVLRAPREMIGNVAQLLEPSATDVQPEETDDTNPEQGAYSEFRRSLREGQLELPTMPDIAMRIAKVVNNPDTDSDDIAKVIQADPSIAARIISAVNSAAYRGGQAIETLPDAVTRLGRAVTHNLVTSFALGNLFKSDNVQLQKMMSTLRRHSAKVAAICHELARLNSGFSPDHALLAGLVHDIGAVPIISAARSHPEVAGDPERLTQIILSMQGELGAVVLRSWQFDAEFVNIARHADHWMIDEDDRPSYLDLVIIAQLHSFIGTAYGRTLPRLDLVPSFHKLTIGGLSPRQSLAVLDQAEGEIRAVESLLAAG
jgi:HD-like signal output (HDOD) protein